MKYGKRYVVEWSPWLLRVIITIVVIIFTAGVIMGYGISRVATSNDEKPIEVTVENTTTEVAETTHTTTEVTTSKAVEPDEVYYDCPLSHSLQDYIRELCEKNDIPMSLVIALIRVESSFLVNTISDTGDYGLMQINKINHEWLFEEYGITDFLDPYENVFCGITILTQHYNRFQDVDKALMAYNLGATGARRLWEAGIYETSYTQKIKAAMEVYENEV